MTMKCKKCGKEVEFPLYVNEWKEEKYMDEVDGGSGYYEATRTFKTGYLLPCCPYCRKPLY